MSIDSSLGELELLLLRAHGDKVVQVDVETGEKLTASLALNRAVALAKWLIQNGVKPGDAISINSENRLEFVIVPLATFLVGAVFAPLNPEYTTGELNHVLNLSKPKIVFCSNLTVKNMLAVIKDQSNIQKLVLFGSKVSANSNITMYRDIIKEVKEDQPADEEFEAVLIDPKEAVATILCSSGTTGLPKGVMTTHSNMTAFIEIARIRIQEMLESESNSSGTVTFGLTPFFHSMGFMSMYMNFIAGNLVVVMRKFKTKLFLEGIAKYKVTMLVVPPPIILILNKHPLVKNYDLSSLRDVRAGAAPMGKEMEKEVKDRLKLQHISQNYGMTETTLGVLMTRYNECKFGSVGQIVPTMKVKIVDEDGRALGPNQEGELCFKGPMIMKGYVGDPVSTANTIDKDGWLHTGDIGYYDNDKYFFIVDRIKELIKYKAFQVAPAELEALLLQHPSVTDSAVVGLPDEEAGELPLAFIVKKSGVKVSEKELLDYVAGNVSRQKRLTGGVIFIEEIPRNPSGKILRRVLKERAKVMKSKAKL